MTTDRCRNIATVVVCLWSLRLSEALYPIRAIFEVTPRNANSTAPTLGSIRTTHCWSGGPTSSGISATARVPRNRVAHNQPMFSHESLADDHAATVEIIGWMSHAMADLVTLTDRFDEVWEHGEHQARGRLGELWRTPSGISD